MTPAIALEMVRDVLFPPYRKLPSGAYRDSGALLNLEAALETLESQGADEVSLRTIGRVIDQLAEAKKIFDQIDSQREDGLKELQRLGQEADYN